ncbi:MAG: hypothetical protein Kow0010_03480 [Dehalococcoidia bacterium]
MLETWGKAYAEAENRGHERSLGVIRRHWTIVGVVASLLAIALLVVQATGLGETTRRAVTDALQSDVIDDPRADEVVAIVNGQEIKRREIAAGVLFSTLEPGGDRLSPEEALAAVIDQVLLTQAAHAAGIEVTDEEADQMVAAATQPFEDGTVSKDDVELMEQLFKASTGMTMDEAFASTEYREALADMLRRGRYIESTGKDRETLLAELRAEADIQIFEDRVPEVAAK